MKKLFLMFGLACLLLTSCNNNTNNQNQKSKGKDCQKNEQCEKACAEMKAEATAVLDKLAKWDNFTDAEKKDVVYNAKALIEKCEAMKAKHNDGKQCKEGKGDCEKAKAAAAEKWAKFDQLTLDEQKALVEAKIKHCQAKHEGCNKDGQKCDGKHEGCKKDGQKCDGKHEGCKKDGQKCEGKEGCCKKDGQKCDGKHEGCQKEAKKCDGKHEGCQSNK